MTVRGAGKRLFCRCQRGPSGLVEAIDPRCLWRYIETVYDGPAGCGKTFYDCLFSMWVAQTYPFSRQLWLRETLKSHRESVQPIFEEHVLGPGHPILLQGGSRDHRTSYTFPSDPIRYPNRLDGGHIALGGLDRPDLYHSSEWDLIFFFEATNPRVREYDYAKIVGRGLRGIGIPHPHCRYPDGVITDDAVGAELCGLSVREVVKTFGDKVFKKGLDPDGHPLFFRQSRLECNPSDAEGEAHWVWQRILRGMFVRVQGKHEDNPTVDETYLNQLRSMPEPLRSVFYEGKWLAASGRVWPTYKPQTHLIRGDFTRDVATGNRFVRIYDWPDERGNPKTFPIVSVVAGFDWGLTSPSTLQVFAVTANRVAFRVAELYRVTQPGAMGGEGSLAWFAERVVELVQSHGLEAILCDPSSGGSWELFNTYLQKHGKSSIAVPADNTRKTKSGVQGGLDLVRSMFAQNRLFLFDGCHIGPHDPELMRLHKPVGWQNEIPNYVLARDPRDSERILDHPDERCIDHGCDAARMALMDIFQTERTVKPKPSVAPLPDPWVHQSLSDMEREMHRERVRANYPRGLRQLRGRV